MADKSTRVASPRTIAYFSMEIGLTAEMHTYSGGLGVLAGDSIRAAADLELPMVAVTLVHHDGYFAQHLDASGEQRTEDDPWSPESLLDLEEATVTVRVSGRSVRLQAWRYDVTGVTGHSIPVYMLDARVPENDPEDQKLTDVLYGGDHEYRLRQEAVLGIGGIMMLRALGHIGVRTYHMNEGHSALLTVALLQEILGPRPLSSATDAELQAVRDSCVFTVHTPVAAGHDRFEHELVRRIVGEEYDEALTRIGAAHDGLVNMTEVALHFSRSVNGVSLRHRKVSRLMFPHHRVEAITNGVHATTWTSPHLAELYDEFLPGWRRDNGFLRYVFEIAPRDVAAAHQRAKDEMIAEIARRTGVSLAPSVLTIGFARRATGYKRADLLFHDMARLKRIAAKAGGLQLVYGGKAHPNDGTGRAMITNIHEAAQQLGNDVKVLYVEGYDMDIARYLVSGVDLWLNNPQKPLEASGTSGMKAALNGVPSLSIIDGWWVEGHVEGVTGWAIGDESPEPGPLEIEAASLYEKLEERVVPLFRDRPAEWAEVMRYTIALNGSYFTAQRMMDQYRRVVYEVNSAEGP